VSPADGLTANWTDVTDPNPTAPAFDHAELVSGINLGHSVAVAAVIACFEGRQS
jgi:hypothetical protein